jgi:hypothetical protein
VGAVKSGDCHWGYRRCNYHYAPSHGPEMSNPNRPPYAELASL